MRIKITMDVDDEYADPNHRMGVTLPAFEGIHEALRQYGEDIDVVRDNKEEND